MNSFDFKKFNTNQSMFIEASAGTGKTYTIQLIVSKLIKEGIPLNKILIVTYTEKAAGELKDRIRKKMVEVLKYKKLDKFDDNESELSKDILEYFVKAEQDIDNASIFTIHSFCQKTLREYAYDAHMPFDMSMIEEEDVVHLVEQYFRDIWIHDRLFLKIIKNKNIESLTDTLKKIFKNAINSYKGSNKNGEIISLKIPTISSNTYETTLNDVDIINNAISYKDLKMFPELFEGIEFFEKSTSEKAKSFADELKKWNFNSKEYKLFDGRKFQARFFKEDEELKHFNAIYNIKETLNKINKELITIQINTFIYNQIPVLFEEWQKIKSNNKCQSFNDMIMSVHKAVLENDCFKEKLRNQYNYAIIDEFQDTNKLQWDIFGTLFLKDKNKPIKDHFIFVVGDPKQSIYRFQGADINVYKDATNKISHGTSLNRNFRSTEGIIEGCNQLFSDSFFTTSNKNSNLIDFTESFLPENENNQKVPPLVNGKEVPSFWISEPNIEPAIFANTVVSKIVEWCTFNGEKTVLQVFDKDNCKKYRNVSFKDFAILARTRSEMELIEDAMRESGIPFSRYKDNNLFNCRECHEWIALFKALSAHDFSAWNRKLLNEVLITDFFSDTINSTQGKIKNNPNQFNDTDNNMDYLHYIESKIFDDPNNPERKKLNSWRDLALKRCYAEMLEKIYNDTQIDTRLMDISKLQNLAKLKQIGNYSIDYLYNNNCSLNDLVVHLEDIQANLADTDEDENLVEKGTDYDAVQVMTIHASKGLEFPIVISVAGYKGAIKNPSPPFFYHDKSGIHLGLDKDSRDNQKKEEHEEWKRLFYVDFTRASSILILPQYNKWVKEDESGTITIVDEFKFLYESHKNFCLKASRVDNINYTNLVHPCYSLLKTKNKLNFNELKNIIQNKIFTNANKEKHSKPIDSVKKEIEIQKKVMDNLQKSIPEKCIMQYSYSSLSGKSLLKEENTIHDDEIENESQINKSKSISIKELDLKSIFFEAPYKSIECKTNYGEVECNFPRGNKLGNAIHHIFERAKFFEIGKQLPTIDDALNDAKTRNVIEEEFKNESLPIWKFKKEWISITTKYLWNTLHAKLPVINGSKISNDSFSLVEIPLENHKAEMQFNLNTHISDTNELHKFCKGFIDLMFIREDSQENKRYSILDWKSDIIEENMYSPEAIKKRVDNDYSIQRILYSYSLIQWLKQFYGVSTSENLSEEEIFNQHFGGIYYVFIRGTQSGTSKAIYAQTWSCYNDLKIAFDEIKKLMSK